MNWEKYTTVYEYVSRLPKTTSTPYLQEDLPHEQAVQYARKANPIRPIERIHLEFSQKQETTNPRVHTSSLWSVVCALLEETHLLGNPSMKKCNVQFVTQSLQKYLTDKTIYSFLTGRRVYPLLELLDKPYVLYEKKHQRSFIHVEDIALSFLFAINNFSKMNNDIFNVGDESMNYSKEDICQAIKSKISKLYIHFAEFDKDLDQRNYIVSYKKINDLGFKTTIDLNAGLDELLKSYIFLTSKNRYSNI